MAENYNLRIVSPDGNVLKDDVSFAVFPGEGLGELGVLPNHAHLIAALKPGVIRYTKDSTVKKMAISGGFVEIGNNAATVLAETAEPGDKIDVSRAQTALARAEKRLANKTPEVDVKRAELSLARAKARLQAAGKGQDLH
ncbi:MAG: F0F1 ATP synthase subunit epsilon [Peptococcaceae bacterium]|jgi:F-type H+-transporting ATPase subunit epsilon|nr:F0F1 ATP synthase subunit epsilon [Peptococcaceae bacterium]